MAIKHVLADGRIVEDITGYTLRPDTCKKFYEVLVKIRGDTHDKKNQDKD